MAASCSADDDGDVDGAVATTGGTAPGATTSPVDTAAPVTSEPSAAAVGADIEELVEAIETWHPDAYHHVSRDDFEARVETARAVVATTGPPSASGATTSGRSAGLRKTIELWGCGALGSWIAEQLARAGASTVTLRDTGYITQGMTRA